MFSSYRFYLYSGWISQADMPAAYFIRQGENSD